MVETKHGREEWQFERAAIEHWGEAHPAQWPVPPHRRPSWWQFRQKALLSDLETVFGSLNDDALFRYWRERRKGQDIYEDAGGYLWRCYAAMAGFAVAPPYTYAQAADDLASALPSKD